MKKLWGGRFRDRTDARVEDYTESLSYDRRLWRHDIRGSIVHARMLGRAGVIPKRDAAAIVRGLKEIAREIEEGSFPFRTELEDIHMNIEARLIEKIGPVGGKLHTARSRNDQIALDIRLYLREETERLLKSLRRLRKAIVLKAGRHMDVVLPGYTHLQRAQPVLLAHHLLAYYEMFTRDGARFRDLLGRINVLPLGAAALAGTPFPIDRHFVARQLGFEAVSENSIDSVSDRDFVIEFLSASSILMMHLSRLSEEIVLWASSEFAFIELPDAYATGSSIMPQKKNPDVAELTRGKTGRVYGGLVALLTLMKGLPLAYNRDMQEDKEPLFDTVDTVGPAVELMTGLLRGIRVKRRRMKEAAAGGFTTATDFADYLVSRGLPFREAHAASGRAVAYCIAKGRTLEDLSLDELRSFSDRVEEGVFAWLSVEGSAARRRSYGGTARERVEERIRALRELLSS